MKRDVVLLVDADAETLNAVSSIAALSSFDVRFAQTAHHFFPLNRDDFSDVALIVFNAVSDLQSLNLLEALAEFPSPPVIMIAGLDKAVLRPTMYAHVVTEILGKPVSIETLRTEIGRFVHTLEPHQCRCDVWGHPCADCTKRRSAASEREIAPFAEKP